MKQSNSTSDSSQTISTAPIPATSIPTPASAALIVKTVPLHALQLLSTAILYLGFAATGVCMALPGAVLPALLSRWHLDDSQAGSLFFVSWLGTSIGALCIRPPVSRSLTYGSLLLAIACLGIAFIPTTLQARAIQTGTPGHAVIHLAAASLPVIHAFSYLCMGLFGIGLGITMTATSLLRSSRHAGNRALELNRLNLVWSLGACLAPTLAEHSLRVTDVRSIFTALGACFALLSIWVALAERDPKHTPKHLPNRVQSHPDFNPAKLAPANSNPPRPGLLGFSADLWPLAILAAIGLPTGIESSMGAWTAAYVQRSHQTIAATVTAGTCFWTGLMLSRTLSSFLLRQRRWERFVMIQSLATVVLGLLLLIANQSIWAISAAVLLTGFGLGPIYPMLLGIALQFSENTTIFFIAGLGSASIPWITGALSSHASSLRIGLAVPLAASILMLWLGLSVSSLRAPNLRTPLET